MVVVVTVGVLLVAAVLMVEVVVDFISQDTDTNE